MDNEIMEILKEESLLDAAIIEQMDLRSEEFMAVSSILHSLNYLKAIAKQEDIPMEEIDRKMVIRKLLNKELTSEDLNKAVKLINKEKSKYE